MIYDTHMACQRISKETNLESNVKSIYQTRLAIATVQFPLRSSFAVPTSGKDRGRLIEMQRSTECTHTQLDVPNLALEILQLFLHVGVFLGHLFVLGLPLGDSGFESLDFALVVAGFHIS